MTSAVFIPCSLCKHFVSDPRTNLRQFYCEAFPDGVPEEIMNGANLHTTAIPGDNGIRFEVRDGREEQYGDFLRRREQFLERINAIQ